MKHPSVTQGQKMVFFGLIRLNSRHLGEIGDFFKMLATNDRKKDIFRCS
jgi:hypothetical protein